MLCLRRKIGEEIVIGENIIVKVLDVRTSWVSLGIQAPRDVPVIRREIGEPGTQDSPKEVRS